MNTELHRHLRQAVSKRHQELERQPLLVRLLSRDVTLTQYGDVLAALHGAYSASEAAVLAYLQRYPGLFDYRPRRKLPALDADLSSLARAPLPLCASHLAVDSVGALVGTLYTLEGSTLGGQVIARVLPPGFPRRFYTVYGEHTARRWEEFLLFADANCPKPEYDAAATGARALFALIQSQLDGAQARLEPHDALEQGARQ
jgi:heme oxygenase